MGEIFNAKIKGKELVNKSNFSRFIDKSDLDKKIAALTTKAELIAEQDKIEKLQVFDSSYFLGKVHFEDDSTPNYLVFQPVHRYLKKTANSK